MSDEVAASSLGCLYTLDSCVGVNVKPSSGNDVFDILRSLPNIAFDIHGETRCFRNGETEVESDNTRNATKTDENAPAIVHMFEVSERVVNDAIFESFHCNE